LLPYLELKAPRQVTRLKVVENKSPPKIDYVGFDKERMMEVIKKFKNGALQELYGKQLIIND
jgi:hypothetical protein